MGMPMIQAGDRSSMPDSNEEIEDSEDIGAKLQRAHEQLDAADRELNEIAEMVDQEVNSALREAGGTNPDSRTLTSLRTGEIRVKLPIDRIVGRLNRQLSGPYYAVHVGDGDIDLRTYEEADYGIRRLGDIKPKYAVKQVVEAMARDYGDDYVGAPIGHVEAHLARHGYSDSEFEEAIDELIDKGEIYAPDSNHLRPV